MGHNYSKHFGKNNNHEHTVNVNVNVVEEPKEEIVETFDQETTDVVQYINGVVSGCERLNVRKESNKESDVLCILDKDSDVQVEDSDVSEEFYKVITPSGVEGYCMKKFITIK